MALCGFATYLKTQSFCDLKICNFLIFDLWTSAFCPQQHTFSPYKYRIFCSNSNLWKIQQMFKKLTFRTVLRQNCAKFWRHFWTCDLWIDFEILLICYLRTGTPKKFCDSRMSWRICGFAIACPSLLKKQYFSRSTFQDYGRISYSWQLSQAVVT